MPQHKMTTEEYKKKVFKKYGDKVEILSEYNGGTEPINILYHCKFHGDTHKTLNAKNIFAKSFQPCDKCNSELKSAKGHGKPLKNKEYYYNKLNEKIHDKGGRLLTDKWTTAKDNYKIMCDKGHIFITTADCINSKNQWCPYCYGRRGDFESYIREIIESKDGILLSQYINQNTHVKVKCNKHNYIWDIMPLNLKKGRWCPICNLPYSEKVVYDYLINNNYKIQIQYTFNNLKSEKDELLKFDFALLDEDSNLLGLIEVDDNEHRYNTKQPRRIKARERDNMKNKYCEDNNIQLFRLPYDIYKYKSIGDYKWYFDYIHNSLNDFLTNINPSTKEEN